MKTLRLLFAASVLTFTFCLPTLAGDISTMAVPPAPPSVTTEGDTHTGLAGEITTMNTEAASDDSVTDAALVLLRSVMSLF